MDAWNALGSTDNNLKRYDRSRSRTPQSHRDRSHRKIRAQSRPGLGEAKKSTRNPSRNMRRRSSSIQKTPGRMRIWAAFMCSSVNSTKPFRFSKQLRRQHQRIRQCNSTWAGPMQRRASRTKLREHSSRSVELEPTPARWNGVAYEMALDKIDLSQAQKYAESAVSLTAEHSREISLENLSNEDAQLPATLAAYWDTLGWIHFQQEQVAEAEKSGKALGSSEVLVKSEITSRKSTKKKTTSRTRSRCMRWLWPLLVQMPETKPRLVNLLGGDSSLRHVTERALEKLTQSHTIKMKNSHDADGIAEFWILLTPGPKVIETRFISGDESLRAFASDLQAAPFANSFPDAAEINLPRRGELTCSRATAQCSFLLMSAETVRSAN